MSKNWDDLVGNPEKMGEMEKKLWIELEPILGELLTELKRNNKIERIYLPAEVEGLRVIVQTMKACGANYNLLLHANDNHKDFLSAIQPFGFDEPLSVHLFIEVAIVGAVVTCEMFRTLLLFHAKDLDPQLPLGPLLQNLEKSDGAPSAVAKLRSHVDLKLRNALAHGLVGIEGKKIVLYKNAKFEVLDKLDLGEFMIRCKKQNVLTQCFITVINAKKREGLLL
jgi:hypothetical protein